MITLGLAVLFSAGCGPKAPSKPDPTTPQPTASAASAVPWFQEVGSSAGLTFTHQTGHRQKHLMPEINTAGVGVLDFDNDGLMDIWCVQAGSLYPDATNAPGHRLYKNLGGWKFKDVTEAAGIGAFATGYGMGIACGDYDNDGFVDVFISQVGENRLYHNNGNGTFTETSVRAGVAGSGWSSSAAWIDYDRDGWLDLVVTHYLVWSIGSEPECFSRGGRPDYCSPLNYQAPAKTVLYHNRGNGTFEDVSARAGLSRVTGTGLGVTTADVNGDGWPDLYVVNDAMPNHLWINQKDGTFKEEAMLRGCAVNAMGLSEAGMGVIALDPRARGQWDFFVTHLASEFNRYYANSNGWFTDLVTPKGPGATSWGTTGWGVVLADFDLDGESDFYVANGRVRFGAVDLDSKNPYAEPNQLLRGIGALEFEPTSTIDGTTPPLLASSRALAAADFDNDGAIDLVVANRDDRYHLLKNVAPRKGAFIQLRILESLRRDAVGAVVQLQAGGRTYRKQVQPNEGYCSSHDPRLHFGLGKATTVDSVDVLWQDGATERFGALEANRLHVLTRHAAKR